MSGIVPWRHVPPTAGRLASQFRVFALGHGGAGAESLDNRRRRNLEGRPYALIQAVLGGQGWFTRGGVRQRLEAGSLFVCTLPSATAYGSDTGWVRVWASLCGPTAMHLCRLAAGVHHGLPCDRGPIGRLVALHAATGAPPHVLAAEAFAVLAELGGGGAIHDPALTAALALAHERLGDPTLAVADLATAAGLSRFHFSRRFAAAFGEAPMQYVIRQRLALAARLLAEGGQTVQAVARRCGYGNRTHFSAAFAAQHGLPPQAWRFTG
jgi:AraC-like DNA-binding protein